jgi:hypothetical protein
LSAEQFARQQALVEKGFVSSAACSAGCTPVRWPVPRSAA